ncbi:Bac-rhamnosid6H domain-containing protein [Fusarium falciforme]|uniref:Bac-rhamnosid6H domain-containing protein n=1 Tax=Fusarium falciforme TaxID=195108 RepID=UPI0022FFDA36|nr:Bac-rhamnosid6H domain-containing protein [Fusarium falciforme]WAO86076.1 Bac-rhamnosid6H domain-containing protein [Fusarium falciforme]
MSSGRDTSWIWHPDWIEKPNSSSAGVFVHFRKLINLEHAPNRPVRIAITADTRYKLYINSRMIHDGPVKGDEHAWFYDVLDIQPHLCLGRNTIAVHVLRFYHAPKRASSFARNAYPGLYIKPESDEGQHEVNIQTDETWKTAIDPCIHLPAKANFDNYLNIFEQVDQRESHKMRWVAGRPQGFKVNYGHSTPCSLCPRMTSLPRRETSWLKSIHNVKSLQSPETWSLLLDQVGGNNPGILLPRGTTHHVEFDMEHYTTAHVRFCFARPSTSGSILDVTWCERYSDEPTQRPFPRYRRDRADTTGFVLGPKDQYILASSLDEKLRLWHDESEGDQETFAPFHYRAFRFFALGIRVAQDSDLALKQIAHCQN